jgi:Major Facilitator Superfamily
MLAVYAIVNGNQAGWTSVQTLGLLATAAALLGAFLTIESRVASPLVPLGLFRLRNPATANGVAVLWAGAMFAWFFLSALYLQLVLGYSPLQVGLAFLPANLIMGAFSLGISAKLVMRFGIKRPLAIGLLLAASGLRLFARAPVSGHFAPNVLPSMLLLGLGAGIAFNPMLLAAMGDVHPSESGLAFGRRQYLIHDGRRAGTGDSRQRRGITDQPSARLRAQRHRGAQPATTPPS